MSRKGRRSGAKRSYTPWIIVALVVVTAFVGYYIFTQSGAGSGSSLNGSQVSLTILNELSGVSSNTLSLVGTNQPTVQSSKPISGTPLVLNGKPEVLYMGAEYCPYCAAERWAMIVALDKFGNFTGIEYMQSSATDVYPNTPTFTFVGANYTSNYISFVSVEQLDRSSNQLQTATASETALLNQYDTGGSIPFIDFGNQYAITGAQYLPTPLQNANWTQIASQVNNPTSPIALSIDGAANHLISAICKIDGGAPSSICSQSFAQVVSYVRTPASGGSQQLLVSDAVLRGTPSSVGVARFAPNRSLARI
jgi:thiol-disulfide isomerase/thioredoxin